MDDAQLKDILRSVKTIALVGASPKPDRPSHEVMQFLQQKGYRVIPVNPGQAGTEINGERVYASLGEIPEPYDMVDIFLRVESVGDVVDAAIDLIPTKEIKVIWMQLDIIDAEAARRAEAAGLTVVMDHCPKMEYQRLT